VRSWRELPLGNHVLGESPRWVAARGLLSWVDAVQGTVSWAGYDGDRWGRVQRFGMRRVTAAVPCARGWWVAAGDRIVEVSPVGVELGPEHVVSPDHPAVRTNDMAVDPTGRLVVSLFTEDRVSPHAELVRLDPDTGVTTQLVGDVVTGNGIGFSPDGSRMYWVDTARGTLSVASYDPVGSAGPATVIVREPAPGRLDGLVVDPSGDVWVAVWDRGEVRRYAPDGTRRSTLATPVARPSALALVGADPVAPDLLVVTTARRDLTRVDGCPAPDPEGRLYAYPLV
jgi:sugar lactone lactonase YvrE